MSRSKALLVALLVIVLGACPACTQSTVSSSEAGCATATIVPDNPRLRAWDSPLSPSCLSGVVLAQVDCLTLGGTRDRFQVPAGRVDLTLVFRDTQDTLPDRRLETRPVGFSLNVQAGRTYRIRGVAFYPPGTQKTSDLTRYRVVFAAQDMSTGQIVQKLDVPVANNVWGNTSTDLLMDALD